MVRPKSFHRVTVIDDAMRVFWRQGFQATTMREIGKATNLNPGSLYGSFGNKRDLFYCVLEHYYKKLTEGINQSINNAKTNSEVLSNFFQRILADNENTELRGCLLVNCLLEMAHDREMQAYISAMFSGFEEMFYWVIVQGQRDGTYNPRLEARLTAQYLVNNYFGLRVQCMTEKDTEQLSKVVDNFLSILD